MTVVIIISAYTMGLIKEHYYIQKSESSSLHLKNLLL